ncbi:MAG: hypothetical protein K6T78_15480 [Alicyclobacillus sp.]|nr:hypothetical protein [Alicyclobacillus sp.]
MLAMVMVDRNHKVSLEALYSHAVTEGFTIVEEAFWPVNMDELLNTLEAGDAIFVDTLQAFGETQEAVLETLEQLVIERRIRVLVLIEVQVIDEVLPSTVRLIQAFRRLDVILTKRAA